jgi:hypothetical protein
MSDPTDPPEDSASRLLRELAASPTAKLARELAASPTAKLARELAQSPTAKLAREMAESPAARLARGMALAQRPELTGAVAAAAKVFADLKPLQVDTAVTKALAQFKPMPVDAGVAKALAGIKPIEIDASIAKAFAQSKPIEVTPGLAKAISEAHKALSDFGKPYGGLGKAVSALEEQSRALQKLLVASLGGSIGNIARANQWASTLGKIELPEITKLYPKLPNVAAEVARLHDSVLKSLTGPTGAEQERISAMLGLSQGLSASLEITRLKMSAFAGVTDALGTQTRAWDEAYRSLFGEWRTRPDLPENYWRDARVRRRMYDAAEVDPGLAGAGLKVAVAVVVESGLTPGARSNANAVAVITLGDVWMTIRSHGTRNDAYKVLERFEEELRAYITRKLSEKFGPNWFKLRVDGNVAGDVKRIRKQALERGENPMPLINYTELGHLASIIVARKNWDEVFGSVFINATEFDVDMQKLIATRRPTMHIRPIDGVRLVELICVVQRLSRQMENDGAWKLAAESEH